MIFKRLKKYRQVMIVGFQDAFEYRFDFFSQIVFSFLPVIVQIFLWGAIFKSGVSAGQMGGYTLNSIITYFILANLVGRISEPGIEGTIAGNIRNGTLNQYLLKPLSYLGYTFSHLVSRKIIFSGIILIPYFMAIWLLRRYFIFNLDFIIIALFCLSLILSILLNFLINCLIGLATFWLTEVSSFFVAKMFIFQFISGALIPLDLLPRGIFYLSTILPFQYLVFFPASIYLRRVELSEIWQGLAIQAIWIIVFYILKNVFWSKGLKRYSAVGG